MIRTEEISFRIGAFQLQRLSINIAKGEYFVLLGPQERPSFWSAFAA
jgi:ABC-type Fe3+/spermidine/putrescine transport system ATPase subunit